MNYKIFFGAIAVAMAVLSFISLIIDIGISFFILVIFSVIFFIFSQFIEIDDRIKKLENKK